ncbi:KOW domain-containing RNA-binding protein [Peptoniphilus equinus]|uniref:KOW domain-containing RNA-binding protein n=1 Tax=Peptoniphilus equinus TaxID=3016343 RepID=A0ABY7QS56_9FIRM|nr:KOW domain-containing RNA-binding protein [Peptoniphilus equinus]WBW49623.1 KOW domain-containing RNA-binding protein [Peptoniphilus equinus]
MEWTTNIVRGTVVKSKNGRDMGHEFIVFRVLDEKYVELVDGKRRTLACPKKKQIKHLWTTNTVYDLNDVTLDAHVRRLLANYVQRKEP